MKVFIFLGMFLMEMFQAFLLRKGPNASFFSLLLFSLQRKVFKPCRGCYLRDKMFI